MQGTRSLPEFERMSLVMAVILLAYASAQFIDTPTQIITIDIAGLFLNLSINLKTITTVMAAILAGAGIDWILQDGRNTVAERVEHWMVPALTAWIISLPLSNLPLSRDWWFVFIGGGLLLSLVIIAEFVSWNTEHAFFNYASISLLALSYTLFLMLGISMQALEIRLILMLPALFASAGLISLRVQLLGVSRNWSFVSLVTIAFLTAQFGAALNYWPVSSLSFGVLLLGLLYALNGILGSISNKASLRKSLIENSTIMAIFSIIALFLP